MSRTFKESVRAKICRRDRVRNDRRLKLLHKKVEEKRKIFDENPEKFIMDCFQEELKFCYEYSRNFEEFCICIFDMCYYDPGINFRKYFVEQREITSKVVETAKKMGFKVEKETTNCKFTVPAFEKGNRRTPAQMILYKYERALAKKRKERKKQLLAECKRVKKAIADDKFRDDYALEAFRKIYVKSKEEVTARYEEEIVYHFFVKLGLYFKGSKTDEWMFTI